MLDQMKNPRVLPNTIRHDKRSEELASSAGILTELNNLAGMTDTMLRLLQHPGPVDMSHCNTSEIRTAITIFAAAHVILDQLEHL